MVKIRPVELRDAAQVHENCYPMDSLEQVEKLLTENIEKAAAGKLIQLVAEIDDQVIGTVILQRQEHPLYAHRAEISGLVVHPEHQRQGVARELVKKCGRRAKAMGVEILEIGCRGGEPAEKIFPRLGFSEFGRLPGGIREPWAEGKVYDSVLFCKRL